MDKKSAHTHGTAPTIGPRTEKRWPKWITDVINWLLDREPPQPEHLYQYFPPNMIILKVEHPSSLSESALASLMAQATGDLGHGRIKTPDARAILKFPFEGAAGLVFSLVPVEVTSANQQELVNLLLDIYNILKTEPMKIGIDVSIQTVSPNWLLGNASHGILPPSPGSWPVEVKDRIPNEMVFQLIKDVPGKSTEENTLLLPLTDGSGNGIHVAILDTAPAKIDMEDAYETWHGIHPAAERLLGPNSNLHVYNDITTEIELMDYKLAGHQYLMPEHGLVVSNIVNSIVPAATLHLFKVFTPFGAASLETIAQGVLAILRVREEAGRPPFIVNCSFGLRTEPEENDDFPAELRDPVILKHLKDALRATFNPLTCQDGIVVVASSGNYAYKDKITGRYVRPNAHFPAGFDDVIGVGALPNKTGKPFIAASYSNKANKPPNTVNKPTDASYMTAGGEPGRGNGIQGLYASEIPVYAEGCLSFLWRMFTGKGRNGWAGPGHLPPNPKTHTIVRVRYKFNKWGKVEWCGTSLAAPAIAGFLASLWSGPCKGMALNCASARTELDKYIQTKPTNDGEKVILITQVKP